MGKRPDDTGMPAGVRVRRHAVHLRGFGPFHT